jgi:hypothetical protein
MTLTLTTHHTFTIRHSFFPVHNPASRQPMAMPRRTSPVLSAQELRQIVRQMVD